MIVIIITSISKINVMKYINKIRKINKKKKNDKNIDINKKTSVITFFTYYFSLYRSFTPVFIKSILINIYSYSNPSTKFHKMC